MIVEFVFRIAFWLVSCGQIAAATVKGPRELAAGMSHSPQRETAYWDNGFERADTVLIDREIVNNKRFGSFPIVLTFFISPRQ